MSNELLTTGDLARKYGVDRTTVHRRLAEAGFEPALIAGRTRLFDADAVAPLFAKADQ